MRQIKHCLPALPRENGRKLPDHMANAYQTPAQSVCRFALLKEYWNQVTGTRLLRELITVAEENEQILQTE